MSPEQAQGEPLDPRSDIYAIGVVLFELFTGVLPVNANNLAAMVYKKVHEPLQLDTPAAAHLPAPLKPILTKALATAAGDRYPSTRELRAALIEARVQTPVDEPDTTRTIVAKVQELRDATPPAAPPAAPDAVRPGSRKWLMTGLMLAAVVLISFIVRSVLPFFRSTSNQVRPSTVSTNTSPAASGPGRDSPQGGSNAATPSTETGRSNASPVQASTKDSTSSSDRGMDACAHGDAAACVALAQAAEAAKDFQRAADLYLKACNGRAGGGCTAVGVLYNRGLGVSLDTTQAAVYYERGCRLGDMAGCNNLGTMYQFGSIGFRDLAKAADLYERACSNDHMAGCANLGLLFLDSPGTAPQQKARARELLEKACVAGIARACSKVR
jgi:hypothetical protein